MTTRWTSWSRSDKGKILYPKQPSGKDTVKQRSDEDILGGNKNTWTSRLPNPMWPEISLPERCFQYLHPRAVVDSNFLPYRTGFTRVIQLLRDFKISSSLQLLKLCGVHNAHSHQFLSFRWSLWGGSRRGVLELHPNFSLPSIFVLSLIHIWRCRR